EYIDSGQFIIGGSSIEPCKRPLRLTSPEVNIRACGLAWFGIKYARQDAPSRIAGAASFFQNARNPRFAGSIVTVYNRETIGPEGNRARSEGVDIGDVAQAQESYRRCRRAGRANVLGRRGNR